MNTGGIATLVLAFLSWVIDIKKVRKPLWAFKVFGTNSILLFVMSGLWTKTILKISFLLNDAKVSGYSYLYKSLFVPLAGDLNGSLLFALSHVLGFWLILYWLYRKKIFINL